jgi:3',5'-cyclic AMP phosphodiesterase CpdA
MERLLPGEGNAHVHRPFARRRYERGVDESEDDGVNGLTVSRRVAIGAGLAAAVGGAALGAGSVALTRSSGLPSAETWTPTPTGGAPRVAGLHLQFGADASREFIASWHTVDAVGNPRVLLGTPQSGWGTVFKADVRTYRDAKSGSEIRVNHARLTGLSPDTEYIYAAVHDGAAPDLGTFRTAPKGRAAFTFTSFGDQSTPTLNTAQGPTSFTSDHRGSPAAGDVTTGIERIAPLFNLVNGDLCYANLAADRVRAWADWFDNNSRSARHRPWMPAAGNHENELGNGAVGYGAYQTYFALPESNSDPELRGLWYAFTVGAVRIISLNNDDICYQDGGNSYVRGYSGGAQRRFLEAELVAAQRDTMIDWVVVCMHQTAVSTAERANGADLAIREQWLPLFDRYGVDLVVCGHEHHYERSHPIRGAQPTDTRTPIPVDSAGDVIDATKGTVHLVIGGGGTSIPSNGLLYPDLRCRVITAVGAVDPSTGQRTPTYVTEDAPWSAFRDPINPYGFVAFSVDPGTGPGARTTIDATYYAVKGSYGAIAPVDRFRLVKARRD